MEQLSVFKKSPKFYINQITSGHLYTNEVHLTFPEDKDRVLINNLVLGTIKCHSDKHLDEYEVIMSEIADLLDLDNATVYKVTNEEGISGVIVKDVKSKSELLISMDYIFKKLYEKYTHMPNPNNSWITAALSIPPSSLTNPLKDANYLTTLLEMSINAPCEAFKITDLDAYKTNYFSMILFDFLTNQEKRNAIDYSILANPNTGEARLSPLMNFSLSANSPIYSLNNRLVDRESLIRHIYRNYYPYIKELSRCLVDHTSAYLTSIQLICENNTDPIVAEEIVETIKNNIEFIRPLDKEQSGVSTETKVDYTQTTIRINQKVMKKNLLYQNKYPAHPVTNTPPSPPKDDDRVKISIEETLPTRPKNYHTLLIVAIIAFICGLGIAITYLITLFTK